MQSDFPRTLSFLRKEKGLSQKEAATKLGISQALLSHYEKGIRECGLDFLIKAADFYGVSADYLLGRSADPEGLLLNVDDLPEADAAGKENTTTSKAGILPVLNKKIISNSLNVIFDLLAKSGSKDLTKYVSQYIMGAIYRMLRIIYGFNPKNNMDMFSVKDPGALESADEMMKKSEFRAKRLNGSIDPESVLISTDSLQQSYPLMSSSLFSLIKSCEDNMEK